MKTTKEMIEVMQAYEDGAEIEYNYSEDNCGWRPNPSPSWDWASYDYRVKPKPREIWVRYDPEPEIRTRRWRRRATAPLLANARPHPLATPTESPEMTEDEAKTKWCPFVRFAPIPSSGTNPATNRGRMFAEPDNPNCIGSQCMAWRWAMEPKNFHPMIALAEPDVCSETSGYCGLVK